MGKKGRGTGSNTIPYIKGWVTMVLVRGQASTIGHLIIPEGLGVLCCVVVRLAGWLSDVGGQGCNGLISLLFSSNHFKIQFKIE